MTAPAARPLVALGLGLWFVAGLGGAIGVVAVAHRRLLRALGVSQLGFAASCIDVCRGLDPDGEPSCPGTPTVAEPAFEGQPPPGPSPVTARLAPRSARTYGPAGSGRWSSPRCSRNFAWTASACSRAVAALQPCVAMGSSTSISTVAGFTRSVPERHAS